MSTSSLPDRSGSLASLEFDNRFTAELPADPITTNSRRQVEQACYSRVKPTTVVKPQTIAYSREVAALIGLSEDVCQTDEFAAVFAGNTPLPGMDSFAMCYGGHQFGNWAGQLGDGRAINLGEVRNADGDHWMLQLKGAGPTPYSRTADGLAVLRSSVREFLCSEAMHHLGVPTTRALSLVLSGEDVMRDMFYDGNAKLEPGAIVCRVAPSFTRFGSFQIFASRRDPETLKQLVDFTIRHDFPHLGEPNQQTYAAWFGEVCRSTAEMVAHWMRVGFVHGVMNTDNMSILGLTIDYGPYGWLENYDPHWTPNTTDATGKRYRFGNQPTVAHWNLYQLANALLELFDGPELLEQALEEYASHYETTIQKTMADKLGLEQFQPDSDKRLIKELLDVLPLVETDMTVFFRRLATVSAGADGRELSDDECLVPLFDSFYRPEQLVGENKQRLANWVRSYHVRLRRENRPDSDRATAMNAVNPKYVLRNYLAAQAIEKSEQGDHSMINDLLEVLRRPYDEQPENEEYAAKRPDWARTKPGCSMLSCSS